MKRNWLVAISLALLLVIVGLCGCGTSNTTVEEVNWTSQQQGIWVTGQGEVMAVPDIVTLSLGVEAQADTVAEAQTQANEAMADIMTALLDNGVAEADIQTQYFNISQITRWDYDDDEQVVVGYRVTNMVTAKIRDVDGAAVVIDAVVEAGGDLVRINSISFSIDDPSAYYVEARQDAMADALAKAEQLAQLAGVTLGSPTYIVEGATYIPTRYIDGMMLLEDAAQSTSISPGELEITLSVQVTYAIFN